MHNFYKLNWKADRVVLDSLVFRLQHFKNDQTWDLGDQCFIFYKSVELINQYVNFFQLRPNFKPKNILELGMFEGGSIAFWYEILNPEKIVGIDISIQDPSYLKRYISENGLQENIKMYWGTSQTDSQKLNEICLFEFPNGFDLVFDDASHLYPYSKKSFEILFPLMNPGGMYVIEDWAWGHWPEYQKINDPYFTEENEPTKLVFELVEAVGSHSSYISSITIYGGFVAIERSATPWLNNNESIELSKEFELENEISRRSK
ncbi:CmcI family methyltransferase [Ectobacillus panaciterrae]|uniref:CmcI family methyltransferase n=1 Tax=Ectobacillus panaciterrae TaxID=363872 RepID=UPI00041EB45F|nr:class I SAM-dependent methyltransferase [Ectobacillus panaciterrae]